LKYLLDQRLATIPQHLWVDKLLDFDFFVGYKPSTMNAVADALSQRDKVDGELLAQSAPHFAFLDKLRQAQLADLTLLTLHVEITAGVRPAPWSVVDGMVRFVGRLYIPPDSPLRTKLLGAVHGDGHKGVQHMLHRLRCNFHFPNMKHLVQDKVHQSVVSQHYKSEQCTRRVSSFRSRYHMVFGLMSHSIL
jgi:hypothetical protein